MKKIVQVWGRDAVRYSQLCALDAQKLPIEMRSKDRAHIQCGRWSFSLVLTLKAFLADRGETFALPFQIRQAVHRDFFLQASVFVI